MKQLMSIIRMQIVALALLLLLTGCYTAQGSTTIESGGGGTQELIVGFSSDIAPLLGDTSQLDQLRQQLESSGAQVSDWSDENYSGLRAVWEFDEAGDLSGLLRGEAASLYTLRLSLSEQDGKRIYNFSNTVDPSAFSASAFAPGLDIPGLDLPGLDLPGLDTPGLGLPGLTPELRYRVTLPGEITDYSPLSGRPQGEHTIEWLLEPSAIVELSARSQEPLPFAGISLPLLAAILLGIALLIAIALLLLRRRSQAVPLAEGPAMAPPVAAALRPSGRDISPLAPAGSVSTIPLAPPARSATTPLASPARQPAAPPDEPYSRLTPTRPLGGLGEIDRAPASDEATPSTGPLAEVPTGRLCPRCHAQNPVELDYCRDCGGGLAR